MTRQLTTLAAVLAFAISSAHPARANPNVIVGFTPGSLGYGGNVWINPDTYQPPSHSGVIRLDVGEHAMNSGLVTFLLDLGADNISVDCVFTRALHDSWPMFKSEIWGWDRWPRDPDMPRGSYTMAWAVQGERLEPGHYPVQYVCVDRPTFGNP